MIRLRQVNWTPYLFLAPALLVLGITVFLPALQAFYLSFTNYDPIAGTANWQGWTNFDRLFKDEVFWHTIRNTVIYLCGVVPILTIAPLLLAILVNQKLKGMSFFRAAYYVPVIISMVVAGIAWKFIYAENGLFNQILSVVGIPPVPWLTSPGLALLSVMVVTIWKGLGYYMTIYLAGLQSIPADLYEAAAIDGSDRYTKHWDITIPLMRPYLLLVGVISAIAATKIFEEVYVMTQGGPRNSSKTVVYYLYQQGFGSSNPDLSYACTIGLMLFLIVFVLSIINLKISQNNVNVP
ncbi:sugar ABC transporter permease [Chamaesiphon sp. VAR_48_metabat_403]|uniref:carbohydrate ABC transporter permease n=1 Tax=Chamaesiphon sp. VAR_48_metabat_403 TaxID=2964700 RepID=UPI00286E8403|nr:sugar ABC transporter permease [Chamaesiphon sp. VAR_48_metabat_403]